MSCTPPAGLCAATVKFHICWSALLQLTVIVVCNSPSPLTRVLQIVPLVVLCLMIFDFEDNHDAVVALGKKNMICLFVSPASQETRLFYSPLILLVKMQAEGSTP